MRLLISPMVRVIPVLYVLANVVMILAAFMVVPLLVSVLSLIHI